MAMILGGARSPLSGTTDATLQDYVTEIVAGGYPGMRLSSGRAQRAALNGYLDRIVDTDLPELGVEIRHPETLRRWLTAYAAATATAASYDRIRDAATGGEANKPAKTTTIPYREALERLWILEPVRAWAPTHNHLSRLTQAPKHHLADPALAARLVGLDAGALLAGDGPRTIPRDGTFLGALFESLTALSLRVFAQSAEARVHHFRTRGGEHEVDFVVERDDQRVVAFEVKLSETIDQSDVKHLAWLRNKLDDQLLDAVVITTGPFAYRRGDGIGVIPLALLGP
jgi:predicted AAA+ superfamily ATPase